MRLGFSDRFGKQRGKLSAGAGKAFDERLRLFVQNPSHPMLRNHALHGGYAVCRSINITGDIRAVYTEIEPGTALFIAIGAHSQLYE